MFVFALSTYACMFVLAVVSSLIVTILPADAEGITTSPNVTVSASAEIVVVPSVIVLPLRYKSLNFLLELPKSYVSSVSGIMLPSNVDR